MRFKIKIVSVTAISAALLTFIIRIFIGEITFIISTSMFPTFTTGDKIWNNKWEYGVILPRRIKEIPLLNILCLIPQIENADKKIDWGYHRIGGKKMPRRLDIILFKWEETETQLYIKRIIGLPGDTIQIKKGKVYINNHLLKDNINSIASTDDYGPVMIDKQSYFVMGDCRNNSIDSRTNGMVKFQNIIGKASYCLKKGASFKQWKNLYQ